MNKDNNSYCVISTEDRNVINGSIVNDREEETFVSTLPNEVAASVEMAHKHKVPIDTYEDIREDIFEIWRAVLDNYGLNATEISKLITQVKKSYI